jgi:hypothetical protein
MGGAPPFAHSPQNGCAAMDVMYVAIKARDDVFHFIFIF